MRNAALQGRDWEEMATLDPLWAILGEPDKRFGKWQLEEFFRTGEEEIAHLMERCQKLNLPRKRERAIDFGCGVGRLTRALGRYFSECHGVDISSSMIETARRLTPGCQFRQSASLEPFAAASADFIYSNLVLQHQPDQASASRIIQDMMRVLAPGGLLVFQMPVFMPWRNRLQLRRRAYRLLRGLGLPHTLLYQRLNLNPIRMISLPRAEIENIIPREGGTVVRVDENRESGGPWVSGIFYCAKNA
ncbi:MAG TPA: methyltransferase domain-containing protein [Terriglobales bacterium]|jgi:SAM-dependent methyltransferase|nr:methyltransferase domain-containing protein [Terriglobales bacterium]